MVVLRRRQATTVRTAPPRPARARSDRGATPHQPEEPKFLQANNEEVGSVRVVDDKLRVLLIDGQPRWIIAS